MSWRLREPIPETMKDELIRSARAARARYMQEFFAAAFASALRWRRRNQERSKGAQDDLGAPFTARR